MTNVGTFKMASGFLKANLVATFISLHRVNILINSKIHWILTYCQYYILDTNLLGLDSCWKQGGTGNKWSNEATIKIFSDEKQFNEYKKTLKK